MFREGVVLTGPASAPALRWGFTGAGVSGLATCGSKFVADWAGAGVPSARPSRITASGERTARLVVSFPMRCS